MGWYWGKRRYAEASQVGYITIEGGELVLGVTDKVTLSQ